MGKGNGMMQNIADVLTNEYKWNKFSFGTTPNTPLWRFRYLVSCIIVGGNSEFNTLRCGEELFVKYPTIQSFAEASWRELTDLLDSHKIKYEGNKARHIIAVAQILVSTGDIPNTRDGLQALPGVGRHVASVILATCFDQPEFAVDIHVRRIAARIGLVEEGVSDLTIEKVVKKAIPPQQLGHFSRAFVDFGQTVCGLRPRCSECSLTQHCRSVSL
jgi:endonuclease-3